jgi:hypothetical protein
VLKLGQGVLHDGLQILIFEVVDMHKLNPTIAQLMEFQNGLSVKRNLENLSLRKTVIDYLCFEL